LNPGLRKFGKFPFEDDLHPTNERAGKMGAKSQSVCSSSPSATTQGQFRRNLNRKQHHAPPSDAKSASTVPGKLLSRSTSNGVLPYATASSPNFGTVFLPLDTANNPAPPCPDRFIHAETSPPGGRKARLQESTPDSTFPNPPPSTPYSKRYGSEKVRSKAVRAPAHSRR
jgi:hypothetical protein